ncbi:MAG: hypothetical protein ABI370_07545 [Gammaproteobacteria bacterium]
MRIYGSIQTCFWENSDAQRLSDQGKLLATYLFTGPHSNMLGCFRLPAGYITEDLNWDMQKVKSAFEELSDANFITRDESSGWLLISNFLKWNPIQNPKQAKGVQKLFDAVPIRSTISKPLIYSLLNHGKYFAAEFVDRLYTLESTRRNPIDTLSKNSAADKDQEQDTDQNQKTLSSLQEDVVSRTADDLVVKAQPTCPHQEIINLYHTALPMCPPVRAWNKTRQGLLRQRWNENLKHQTLEWWKNYFEYVKQSEFLTGRSTGRTDKPPFVANLEWLVRPSNFVKVIEGNYHGVRA